MPAETITEGETLVMDDSKSKINANDTIILFADLQTGIVELSQTNPLDHLKRAVLALAKLAKLHITKRTSRPQISVTDT